MPRWIKLALAGVTTLIVLAVVGVVVLARTIDVDRYVRLAAEEVKRATGRELQIRGKVGVSVFPELEIVAEDVSLANAPWGSRSEMVRVKRIEGAFALLPLLRREIDLTRLELIEPDVLLETDPKGVGNWVFMPAAPRAEPASPSDQADLDVFELTIERGSIAFLSGASKEVVALEVKRLRLEEQGPESLGVDLQAALRAQPVTVKGTMGRIARAIAKESAWPVRLAFATEGAQATVEGTVDWRASLPALDAAVTAEVNDTGGLAKLAAAAIDVPTPVRLAAKLQAKSGEQLVDPVELTLGKSAITGRVSLRTGAARPQVSARLAAKEIDLAAFVGPAKHSSAGSRLFSDAAFPLEPLRAFDGDAELTVERLVLPNKFPFESVRAHAMLKAGRLEAQPLAASLGGSPLSGRVLLNASLPSNPTLTASVDGKRISLEKVATALGHGGAVSGGSTDLTVQLTGPGESLHRFLGWGNGEVRVSIGSARLSGVGLDALGGALTSILDKVNPLRRTDPYTELKCAVVRLPIRNGVATVDRTIAYESTKVSAVGAGEINFRTERIDLGIRPTGSEGLGIAATNFAGLVRVTGTLSDPSIGVDTAGSARAALSVGGAIMTSGLSLLGEALYSRVTADPHPCQTALAK
jgi:AsmA family protein